MLKLTDLTEEERNLMKDEAFNSNDLMTPSQESNLRDELEACPRMSGTSSFFVNKMSQFICDYLLLFVTSIAKYQTIKNIVYVKIGFHPVDMFICHPIYFLLSVACCFR